MKEWSDYRNTKHGGLHFAWLGCGTAIRLSSFGMDGGYAAQTVSYREDGRIGCISNADVVVDYAYSDDGYDIGYTLSVAGGTVFTRTLTRDPHRRELVLNVANSAGGNFAYSYDALSRPVARNDDTFAYNNRGEDVSSRRGAENAEAYTYDEIGNLLYASFDFATNTYVANNLNQYSSISTLCAYAPLRETIPHYDADGNMTDCGPWSYTYDAASQLVSVSSNGVLLVTNQYDCRRRRVKKITPTATHTFLYDDWNLIHERVDYVNGTTDDFNYYWGRDLSGTLQGAGGVGGLLYVKRNGVIYVPHADANGNILRYTDTAGNVVAAYTYDAFGRTISQSGPLAGVFRHRFSTKYFDVETGLYYYGYRFYSTVLRCWLTRDPIEEKGGNNLYLSCCNNLLRSFDALGENRYITQFDVLNYGGSGGTQLHVGVAVDRWICLKGKWVKTGVTTFDFGVDDSLGWRNTMWSIVGKAKGAISERDGLHLKAPITLKSTPKQDIKMYDMIQKDIANPPFYNLLFHQCVFWSVGAISYGM